MSRTPVTPFAKKSASAERPVIERWTCMSQRPGITKRPPPSTRRAFAGMPTLAEGPTALIREPLITTVEPGDRTRNLA